MGTGLVIRSLAGFFDVADAGVVRRCRARGVFRKRGVRVLVGDRVQYEPVGQAEGVITEVLPRRTELVRPPVANVDHALLVFSVATPAFQPHLLDRALVAVSAAGLAATIALTKCDLAPDEEVLRLAAPYVAAGYPVLRTAAPLGIGIDAVRQAISGRMTVFVGPSGAGKSSLGNALSPDLGLKMGEVSEKIGRGRHTTRHVELFHLGGQTYVVDAPGFSQLELDLAPRALRDYFPEFHDFAQRCAYRGCEHADEASCAVRDAVARGEIPNERYTSYLELLRELREKEAARY
ncbi:ribosome small subunit-dependent GTPase A [Alicyclobacillus sp.]|uniref:ribosome small subunit-dependent GTPase A n=1 Tax=Alicyclobacillus sp. TaxID=61169 RepID=UPI0025BEE67C|nr:ribosome small subunit-dependent GTPase A [Alicyclobacillus sp.]MCL6516423.1 ribosome small subunit-dependent GTPase A [Alicyclobacillus sp.]